MRSVPRVPHALVVGVEERLVMHDGSAHASAELIQQKGVRRWSVKGCTRFHYVVSEILKGIPVKTVCSRRRNHRDFSAGRAPFYVRSEVLRLHLKLVDGV